MKEFIDEAIENNPEFASQICEHYDKTIDELKAAMKCRVYRRGGKNPFTRINFTDTQTGLTIKYKKS